jgi:hypothetical protein
LGNGDNNVLASRAKPNDILDFFFDVVLALNEVKKGGKTASGVIHRAYSQTSVAFSDSMACIMLRYWRRE